MIGNVNNNYTNNIPVNDNYNVAKSFGSLFYGVVGGFEFNFKNVVIGLHGFLHYMKLRESSFDSKNDKDKNTKTNENTNKTNKDQTIFKLNNIGVRLMIAYKF